MERYRKKALIEVVGLTPEGLLVQNEGDSSDQWVIDPDTFDTTYEKVEQPIEQPLEEPTNENRVKLLLETLNVTSEVDYPLRDAVQLAIAKELRLIL
jgi:hypothetical protein